MSKRNRPTTAAQAAHRSRRHAYRSAYNSPEGKAARSGKPLPAEARRREARRREAGRRPRAEARRRCAGRRARDAEADPGLSFFSDSLAPRSGRERVGVRGRTERGRGLPRCLRSKPVPTL